MPEDRDNYVGIYPHTIVDVLEYLSMYFAYEDWYSQQTSPVRGVLHLVATPDFVHATLVADLNSADSKIRV